MEGKEFVKFVDGLANVAWGTTPGATATGPVVLGLANPHGLLAEIMQQSEKALPA
jgi:hypothetical protein